MTKLVANNVSKKFKSHQVLRGLSFNCEDEILFIAGKNGAGKTTFIRLALGMERLDKGEIHYKGDKELSTSELRKGCVFDTPCLFMEMSGQENINIFCTGDLQDHTHINQILDSLNIDHRFLMQKAKTYSFGQQHRLNVAIALIRKPQVLFLDEPTVGLDPVSWELVKESIILNQQQQKGCVIITGQDFSEMEKMANKVLILDEGQNKYLGTPEELIRRFPKRILLKTKSASLPEDIKKHIVQVDADENENFSYLFSAGEQTDDVFIRIKNSAIEITHLSIIETNLKEAFMKTINL